MLNISHNELHKQVSLEKYAAFQKAQRKRHFKYFNRFLGGASIVGFICLFLPWTQNVTGKGYVTTLTLAQRPQTIQSPIPGRIEKWYVSEGTLVKKGDTILHISEIKSEYMDPLLVERTNSQRDIKNRSVASYKEKVIALKNQIASLQRERILKLDQAKNKLGQAKLKATSDSINYIAVSQNLKIAETQYNRAVTLANEGLKATKDVEEKNTKFQEMQAKAVAQQNKLLVSQNEIINQKLEINRIQTEYTNKISKAQSDLFSAETSQFETEAQVIKLDNQSANYKLRNDMYFITAPQDGYINKAVRTGIGETFKEGEKLVNIMPTKYDLAVETYVDPLDLPLMHVGEKVRIQFDGWPVIVFSGWPNASVGTYGGEIVAVETFISDNGKFRILVAPDPETQPWPKELRPGSGANTIALLDNVAVWYELWRQLNGFPPNYYTPDLKTKKELKLPKIKPKK